MKKIWSVARTEFFHSIRSKAFIVGLLAVPLMLVTMALVQTLVMERRDTTAKHLAVIDRSGELYPAIVEAAAKRTGPARFVVESVVPPSDNDFENEKWLLSLSDQVRKNQYFAFVIIEPGILGDQPQASDLRYYTDAPTYRELPEWLESVIQDTVREKRLRSAGYDPDAIKKLTRRSAMQRLGLSQQEAGGKISQGAEEDEIRTLAVPVVMMVVMYLLLMTGVPILLTTVMEEKINKISEFLVSAISPFQLLMGKLIGAILVLLVLSTLYIGSLVIVATQFNYLDVFSPVKIAWFYLFLTLGGLMLGSVCVAIGAACNEIRDSQSFMFPVTMITMFPMMIWMPILESPDGVFARISSLIPPFTPMLMMLRLMISPGVAWWELVLAVLLTTGFSIVCVLAAGKIFRIGILARGQTPSFARLIRWMGAK